MCTHAHRHTGSHGVKRLLHKNRMICCRKKINFHVKFSNWSFGRSVVMVSTDRAWSQKVHRRRFRTHTRIVEAACGTDTCRLPACLHGYLSWPQILHWANSLQALQVIAWQTGGRWKKQGEQAHPAQKVWCQHPMGAKRVESNVSIQNGEIDSPIFGGDKRACLNAKSMR